MKRKTRRKATAKERVLARYPAASLCTCNGVMRHILSVEGRILGQGFGSARAWADAAKGLRK